VGGILTQVIEGLDLHVPELDDAGRVTLEQARQTLLAE
jgi:hypothetical protein